MDIEGAEYQVARHLIVGGAQESAGKRGRQGWGEEGAAGSQGGVACLIDEWAYEAQAMYSASNHKFRSFDVVLPWLLRPCGVDVVVTQYYNADPKLKQLRSHIDSLAMMAGVDA